MTFVEDETELLPSCLARTEVSKENHLEKLTWMHFQTWTVFSGLSSSVRMYAKIHSPCGTQLCEETPGISHDQLRTHVTHTLPLSIQQSSAIGPWPDLWIEYRHKVLQSAQNSPVHRQHSLSPPLPAPILKPGPWRPLTPQGRMPLSPFSCAGETAVWAKLRLRPGYNRFNVQITCNLHQQKSLYCLFQLVSPTF